MAEEQFLDVDTPIPGQSFVVISFISPERVLKKKEAFLNAEFLKWLCRQSNFIDHVLVKEATDASGESSATASRLNYDIVKEKYDDFLYLNEQRLEDEFHALEDFRTTVRGVKVRGVYSSQREAEVRAKVLQRIYKRDNIYVGSVGYWLPWDPNPEHLENQEYLNPELNTLMRKYKENVEKRDIHYQQMKEEMLEAAKKQQSERVVYDANKEGAEVESVNDNTVTTFESAFSEEDPWLRRKAEEAVSGAGSVEGSVAGADAVAESEAGSVEGADAGADAGSVAGSEAA